MPLRVIRYAAATLRAMLPIHIITPLRYFYARHDATLLPYAALYAMPCRRYAVVYARHYARYWLHIVYALRLPVLRARLPPLPLILSLRDIITPKMNEHEYECSLTEQVTGGIPLYGSAARSMRYYGQCYYDMRYATASMKAICRDCHIMRRAPALNAR